MEEAILLVEKDGPVATITLNRPSVMSYANKNVSGDTIGQRRKGLQERGKSQV